MSAFNGYWKSESTVMNIAFKNKTSLASSGIFNTSLPIPDNPSTNLTMTDKSITGITAPFKGGPSLGLRDYDGNIYNTIILAGREWITTNLKTTHYSDGAVIPNLTANTDWIAENGAAGHDGALCLYNNDISNKQDYGYLYNGYSINNIRGLVYFESEGIESLGWRVLTYQDIIDLRDLYGGVLTAGRDLKEAGTTHWITTNANITNSSGFTMIPGGTRGQTAGVFSDLGSKGYLWSSTVSTFPPAIWKVIFDVTYSVIVAWNNLKNGYSVRCVRDI